MSVRKLLAFALIILAEVLGAVPTAVALPPGVQFLPAEGTSGEIKRRALVIGNANYRNIPKLRNPGADATAMARAVQRLGFDTLLARDVDRLSMNEVFALFVGQIEAGSEAFVYYAGHGVEMQGANYLLPTDVPSFTPDKEQLLRSEAITLSQLMLDLEGRRARVSLIILDACRENPFPRTATRSVGSKRGLALVEPPRGSFVIFSAGVGEMALDGLGPNDLDPNGLFTRHLLRLIDQEGLEIHTLVRQLRNDVIKAAQGYSGHQQFPSYYDQMLGEFYFRRTSAAVLPTPDLKAEAEAKAQRAVAESARRKAEVEAETKRVAAEEARAAAAKAAAERDRLRTGRQPKLVEGKRTLFKQVIVRPGAALFATAVEQGGAPLRPFSVMYVYGESNGFVEVGKSIGVAEGFVKSDKLIDWKQTIVAVFSGNRANRERSLMFKKSETIDEVLQDVNPRERLNRLRADAAAGRRGDLSVAAIEPDPPVDLQQKFYFFPILSVADMWLGRRIEGRVLHVAALSKFDPAAWSLKTPRQTDPTVDALRNNIHALELPYLGLRHGTSVPLMFQAYLPDRDLSVWSRATTEIRLLVTKSQLETMAEVSKSIIDAAEKTTVEPAQFFTQLRRAIATIARNPDRRIDLQAATIGGMLGEFLNDLPYASADPVLSMRTDPANPVLSIDADMWVSMGAMRRKEIRSYLQYKLRFFEEWLKTPANWISLTEGTPDGEQVSAFPLLLLP